MNQTLIDEKYMRRCIQLASCGQQNAKPNPMVGAVIVAPLTTHHSPLTTKIIGEGYHVRYGEGHAEVNAFAAVRREDEPLLSQSTLYVSLEPCSHYGKTPPCADLIIRKGVRRVVVGCEDDFAEVQGRGIQKLREAGIEVTVGVLEKECRELNRRFLTFHRHHRPYIILKWAQTANGYIDSLPHPLPRRGEASRVQDAQPTPLLWRGGGRLLISTPFTQMLTHKLRADEDAILVGRVTDERDHPQLNVRHWVGPDPKRLVIDHDHPVNLESLWHHGVQSLIVEGGTRTLQSFLVQNLWDEIRVETNTRLTVAGGTRAPQLPANCTAIGSQSWGSNIIVTYRRPSA